MNYCTEYGHWVEDIEKETGSKCFVWISQLMDCGEIRGCEGCRFLKHIKVGGGKR